MFRSFDHAIRPEEERRRNRQAEGLDRLRVDQQLESGGLLDRKVGGFRALGDPVQVVDRASNQIVVAKPNMPRTPSFNNLIRTHQ
jgi:hypothetical protein